MLVSERSLCLLWLFSLCLSSCAYHWPLSLLLPLLITRESLVSVGLFVFISQFTSIVPLLPWVSASLHLVDQRSNYTVILKSLSTSEDILVGKSGKRKEKMCRFSLKLCFSIHENCWKALQAWTYINPSKNSSPFWKIHIFALLLRVRWLDWYHAHICLLNMKLE